MAQTVATPLLQNMSSGQIFDENYNNQLLYVHAVKVFLMSYPEHYREDPNNSQSLFGTKLKQLMKVLDGLYGQQMSATPGPVINFVWNQCQSLTYFVIFAVKKFTGRSLSQSLSFSAVNGTTGHQLAAVELDHKAETQSNKFTFKDYSFTDMVEVRRQNHEFQMTVTANSWQPNVSKEAVKTFTIGIGHIHPEGYQQWVDFGRGTQLLVEVSFRVRPMTNSDMSDFHLQTIYKMIRRRVSVGQPVQWHRHMTTANCVNCMRDLVEPNSHQMYWPIATDRFRRWLHQIRTRTVVPQPPASQLAKRNVRFFDLQKSVTFGDDIEQTVCLCNEWCNWNAFFHHNPIYRFLLVQNSNLFVENNLNHPDIYLFAAIKAASEPNILPRTGYVIQLIVSANYYRDLFYRTYMMASNDLMQSYLGGHPHPLYLTGVTYNYLKTEIDIVTLCHQLDPNPMANICIKNLLDYYKVYKAMHDFIGQWPVFVDSANQSAWTEEYENNCRVDLKTFVQTCVKEGFQGISLPHPEDEDEEDLRVKAKDTVFGSDTEYHAYLPTTDEEIELKLTRNKALRRGLNPLNMEVSLEPFINCLVCVYKLLPKLEVTFPAVHSERAAQHTNDYCMRLDREFKNRHSTQPNKMFKVSMQELKDSELPEELWTNITAFYTLKLYSFMWFIQKHCLTAKADLLSFAGRTSLTQMADSFRFIFDSPAIEHTLMNISNGFSLFPPDDSFEQLFDDFYGDFWGDAAHEQKNWQQFEPNAESALRQYHKLYVWYMNDGPNGHSFRAIVDHFGNCLMIIVKQCLAVRDRVIAPTIHWLIEDKKYRFGVEVLDVLVIFLVRAACFCTVATVAQLFRQIHGLQLERLCRKNWSFTFGKAGWKELLATITSLTDPLEQLRTHFIAFDDEMNRISDSLSRTQRLCRQFYQFLFMKLTNEWLREFAQIYQDTFQKQMTADQLKTCGDLLVLQFAVGLWFSTAFNKHFRYQFWGLRKGLWLTISTCSGQESHLQRFQQCRQLGLNFLASQRAVHSDNPFATDIWSKYFNQTIPDLQTLRPQDVELDLEASEH